MPNRVLKESICTSDSIDQLSWFEESLFYRLIVNCDDFGRFDGRFAVIKNRLFPLKENLTTKNVESAINKLARVGLITLYESDGKPFLFLPTWNEHQIIRAKRSKYPEPEIICNQMHADECKCFRNPIQSNPNRNPIESKRAQRFTPPSVEEIREYCQERKNGIDPQMFYDFYSGKGWMVGKNKMQDWKAAVRTWEGRRNEEKPKKETSFDMDLINKRFELGNVK